MTPALFILFATLPPLVLAALLRRGHRWLFVIGLVLMFALVIASCAAAGRNENAEETYSTYAVLLGLFLYGCWLVGITAGYGIRRLFERLRAPR